MLRKIANILFIVLAITSCTNNATTEKHQTVRNKIENCYQKVKISPFLFIFHHFTYIRKSLYYSVF